MLLLVNFFESPAHADGVLAHFETGSCNAAGVGCLAGAVEQAVAENLLDCFRGKRHICAFEYCHAAVVDKVLYVVSVHLVLGCARHCDVALEGPDALAAFVILGTGNFVCVNADACAALLLDVEENVEVDAVGIVDVALGVAHCDDLAAELGALLRANDSFEGKTVVISGSGNVAIYATKKATELGGKVVTVSDSNGYIYDPDGIDLDVVKQIKEVERGRIKEYVGRTSHKNAEYHEGSVWAAPIKADIALPCATQNEISGDYAKNLAANGIYAVAEGANMPSTPEAIEVYFANNMLYGPAKAANAGGVATSGLEMSQNSLRLSWTFEEVDEKLHGIMVSIFKACDDASKEYGMPGNYMAGANIAGFLKVAEAMKAQGCV